MCAHVIMVMYVCVDLSPSICVLHLCGDGHVSVCMVSILERSLYGRVCECMSVKVNSWCVPACGDLKGKRHEIILRAQQEAT